MSQAAYYNGYDDGFLDGRRAEARKASPGGGGGSSGPLVVVKPSTTLVGGALNYVAPTRSVRYDWTARLDDYDGQVVPLADLDDNWRPAGAPRYDNEMGWVVDAVESGATPYTSGLFYDDAPTDGYYKVEEILETGTVRIEHVEYTGQNTIVVNATFTAEVLGVTKTQSIQGVEYSSGNGLPDGLWMSSNGGAIYASDGPEAGKDYNGEEYVATTVWLNATLSNELTPPGLAIPANPADRYEMLVAMPDGLTTESLSITGAPTTGAMPAGSGTYAVTLDKSGNSFSITSEAVQAAT